MQSCTQKGKHIMQKQMFGFALVWALLLGLVISCGEPVKKQDEVPTTPTDGGVVTKTTPSITITSPTRAAMLTGAASVKVTGTTNMDPAKIATFQVNGKDVKVAADGSFSATVDAQWGVNLLRVEGGDTDGNSASISQSFLWSKEYRALDAGLLSKAAFARLGKKGIDDGNRSSLNDLASILEFVLSKLEIDPLLPELLVEGKLSVPPVSYKVVKDGTAKVGRRQLSIAPKNDGLDLTILLKDINIPVKGTAANLLNKKAEITATEVPIKASVDLRYANEQVIVDIVKFEINTDEVKVEAFSGVFSFLNKTLTNKVKDLLKTKMEGILKTLLPGPVSSLITGFKLDQSFALPALLGGKTLKLDSKLDWLAFDEDGGTLGLAAAVTSTKDIPDAKLGTPMRSQTPPKWDSSGFAFGVALSYNTLNQVLTAAWNSGALKQDVSDLLKDVQLPIPGKNLQVQIDAQLPPVVQPGEDASKVVVGLGDVKLRLSLEKEDGKTLAVDAHASAIIGATLGLSDKNEISVSLDADPKSLVVHIDKIEGLGDFPPSEMSAILKSFMPKITALLSSDIIKNIPIPSIDLSTLAGQFGIPPGTNLTLQNGAFSLQGDFVQVTGDL